MKLFETLSTYHKTSTNNVTLRGFFPHFLLRFQNGQRIDISSELIKCIQIKKENLYQILKNISQLRGKTFPHSYIFGTCIFL